MRKLQDIAKEVLNEDSWGNNPSAAGSMSPGRAPNATPPPASTNLKFYDLKKDYNVFVTTIEKQEELAKKKLDGDLTKVLRNKKVTVRASKGAIGQVEKDYTITVAGVDVNYMKDKFYIVLKGTDKSDYYANTEFKVKIDATPPKAPTMGASGQPQKPQGSAAKGQVGSIRYPEVMGMSPKGNIVQGK